MTARLLHTRRRGVAAIELALVMAGIGLLSPVILALASVFAQYAALNKAVQEGTRYMASLPPQALNSAAAAQQSAAAARALVLATMAGSGSSASLPSENIYVQCGAAACTGVLAATVHVSAAIAVPLPGSLFAGGSNTDGQLLLATGHTMRYVYYGATY